MPHLLTPNQPSQSKFVTEFWSDTPTNIAMKLFVTLSTLLAVSLAEDAKVVAALTQLPSPSCPHPVALTQLPSPSCPHPVAPVTYAAPITPYEGSQHHAQDEFGNLNYAYSNLSSVKSEAGNTYGGMNSGYSYVDANGVLQQVASPSSRTGSTPSSLFSTGHLASSVRAQVFHEGNDQLREESREESHQ